MSSEELWSLTMEEYCARDDCYFEEQKRWDLRLGQMLSVYVNGHLKEGASPHTAGSFFGYSEDDGPDHEMTPEESIAHAKAMFERRA